MVKKKRKNNVTDPGTGSSENVDPNPVTKQQQSTPDVVQLLGPLVGSCLDRAAGIAAPIGSSRPQTLGVTVPGAQQQSAKAQLQDAIQAKGKALKLLKQIKKATGTPQAIKLQQQLAMVLKDAGEQVCA